MFHEIWQCEWTSLHHVTINKINCISSFHGHQCKPSIFTHWPFGTEFPGYFSFRFKLKNSTLISLYKIICPRIDLKYCNKVLLNQYYLCYDIGALHSKNWLIQYFESHFVFSKIISHPHWISNGTQSILKSSFEAWKGKWWLSSISD